MFLSIRTIKPSLAWIGLAVLALFFTGCAGGGGSGNIRLETQMSWPLEIDKVADQKGKFYLNGQNEGIVTVFDAETQTKLKIISFWEYEYEQVRKSGKTLDEKAKDFIQKNALPHHSWIVPGGRYNYISNTAKGWDRMWVVDTWSDKVIAHMNTGGFGPLHGSFSPFEDLAIFGAVQQKDKGLVTLINTRNHKVLGTIKTSGSNTRDIVFNPDKKHIYVTNSGYAPDKGNMGHVDMLDIRARKLVKSFDITGSRGMKMTYDGKLVGVASAKKGYVAYIDATTHKIIGKVKIGKKPNNVAFNPQQTKSYVGVSGAKKFAVIDLKTMKLKTLLDGGKGANAVYFPPGNNKVAIATNENDDFVTIIDTVNDKVIKTIDTPLGAHNVAYTGDGKIAIISCKKSREAVFVDVTTMEEIEVYPEAGHGNNGVRWFPYGPGRSVDKPYL